MVSQRLINYIKEDLKSYDKEEIKKILVEQGYPEELADNAIKAAIESNEQEKETKGEKEEKEKNGIKELEEERESKKEQLNTKAEESKKKLEGLKKKTVEKARKNSKVLIPILIIVILGVGFFGFRGVFDSIFYDIATGTSNTFLCKIISNPEIKEDCYQMLAQEKENILISLGSSEGTYFKISQSIVKICNLSTNKRECNSVPSLGSVDNIIKINQKKASLSIVDGSIACYAYEGKGIFEDNKIETIRSVISLFPEFIQTIVRNDSNIYSLDGLVNKKILAGSEEGGINLNAKLILEKKGIMDKVEIILRNQNIIDPIALLENGQVDAIFTVSFIPHKEISKLDERVSLRAIPIEDSLRDILISENKFYTKGIIPAGTYSGMESNVNTLSINSILITNKEENEEFIYNLTKNLFENQTFFNTYIKPYIEEAKEGLCIPLHKGAERYYKEKGLI